MAPEEKTFNMYPRWLHEFLAINTKLLMMAMLALKGFTTAKKSLILILYFVLNANNLMLYPDSGISMDEETVLGDMIWSYNKAELWEK